MEEHQRVLAPSDDLQRRRRACRCGSSGHLQRHGSGIALMVFVLAFVQTSSLTEGRLAARQNLRHLTSSPLTPAPRNHGNRMLDQNRLRMHLESKLERDAAHQWDTVGVVKNDTTTPIITTSSRTPGAAQHICTRLLQVYGLCDPELLHVPRWQQAYRTETLNERPFVFLHLSKCAGTSLLKALAYLGHTHFSSKLPSDLSTERLCIAGTSQKCCWWREKLQRMSDNGQRVKVLEQEPANTLQWIGVNGVASAVDPGLDASTDLCPDLAYATVLRSPVMRLHSHMCEIGANFSMWFSPDVSKPGHVSTQLRDNYFVRSLGGADAWGAPEGGLDTRHLLSAARTLARLDVVMTVETLQRDVAAQMGRVGLPDFRWPHSFERSRAENLRRAKREPWLRTGDTPSCEVPPTEEQLRQLVAACAWDAVLYEFAHVLAARRTMAAAQEP